MKMLFYVFRSVWRLYRKVIFYVDVGPYAKNGPKPSSCDPLILSHYAMSSLLIIVPNEYLTLFDPSPKSTYTFLNLNSQKSKN